VESRSSPGRASEAVAAGADRILIDNQSPKRSPAGALARQAEASAILEASGNMRLGTVPYAMAGVDAVSVGTLTHSVTAADVSLEKSAV
jgi:nicotinate-nucleotide pyrophosphorylase (carboxylating)